MATPLVPRPSSIDLEALADAARLAARNAYAPYSGFSVGAAVACANGETYVSANMENASYGLSLCAEANAVAAASFAQAGRILAVAVTAYRPEDPAAVPVAAPCGRCRQLIAEFALPEAIVHVVPFAREAGKALTLTVAELLPHGFGPASL